MEETNWVQRIQALTHVLTNPTTNPSLHSQLFISTQIPCYLNWSYPPVLCNKDQQSNNTFPSLHLRWGFFLFLKRISRLGAPETSWRSKCPFQQPPPLILAKGVDEAQWGDEQRIKYFRKRLRRKRLINMAQRRILGKRPHGSSSRAPQPPVPQLDEHWFRSIEAQARFPWFDNKSIESGRWVNLEQLDRFDVRAAFDRLGWLPVISYTDTTRPNLVKHFFANLELHGDVNDPNQSRDLRISSYVRGVPISFNTHQLADLLGVPNDGDLVYCPPKAKGYLTEDLRREIAHQILNPGAPMKAASLRPIPRVYNHIIQHNIVPQSDHYSELSQLTQYITYCVCTGERVSLPYLIIRTMHQATLADQASNLPYGRLITSLLRHLGVSMRGEVTAEDTMTSDIDWDAIQRMQMVDLPVSDDELEARPRPLGRVAAAAVAAANAAYAAELERDDDEDRAEDVPVPAPQPTPAAPPSTSTAGPSQPPSDTMMSMMMEIRDTQREMSRYLAQLARSLRVTQDQMHWLKVAYERDYDIADPIPPRPPTP